ncbi:MAG TPA: RNA polymerase sigma factor [Gammaproteobacteria bacterium]|nr:RNA polymerase sigma factor [Gammaproteobacteria bacterium]
MPQANTESAANETADRPDERPAVLSAWRFRLDVLQHHRIVYRVAFALVRNPHDAEDVAQETFMRYWRQGGSVELTREWLLRVARNLCLDRLRFAGKWVAEPDNSALEPPDEHDPAWHYQRNELKARLDKLIDALPEPQRSLVVLFDVQGFKGDACARILGISTNQVKVYLHRARRRLRVELERYERQGS